MVASGLYLWTMDCGWRGSIVVVAKDEASAREKMSDEHNYSSDRDIVRHEINEDFIHVDLGDC